MDTPSGSSSRDLATTAQADDGLILRVLAGRVRGAEAPLERGQSVVLGHALDADIVLRDPGAEGVRLRLRARADAADLELESGQVTLLGHELTAPAQAILPLYLPLLIGDNAIAIGTPDSPRWAEADRILSAARVKDDDSDGDANEDNEAQPAAWQYLLNNANAVMTRTSRLAPIALIGVIVIAALFALGGAGIAAWPSSTPKPEKVQAALIDAGFTDLTVRVGADDRLIIEGLLPADTDRARLQKTVLDQEWNARLDVQTQEGVARGVEDVFMANGVTATARPAGAGVVRLDIVGSDPETAARLERVALSEVKGLKQLITGMLPGTEEGRFEDIQEGGGKRVVSVIGGDRGHIATADGARYFPGAVLPTGHRIVAIEETRVRVERNGAESELRF